MIPKKGPILYEALAEKHTVTVCRIDSNERSGTLTHRDGAYLDRRHR
jgi:hypothetical protein